MELIANLEDEPRDLFAGAVFTAAHDGAIDATRVLRAVHQQDGRTWLRAGTGIHGDSTPERAFRETCDKLADLAPCIVENC